MEFNSFVKEKNLKTYTQFFFLLGFSFIDDSQGSSGREGTTFFLSTTSTRS